LHDDGGCRSLLDLIIAAIRAGDGKAAGARVRGVIDLLKQTRGKPMKILYATDGSASAAAAGRLLAALPLPADTQITVLSAVPELGWTTVPPPGMEGPTYPLLEQVAAEEQAEALRTAEAAAAAPRERGLRVIVAVRRQRPVEAILEQAQEDGADLIVVGSHGMGAVERFLIGSVSERVARYAHCSVLVARSESVKRAIVAVDGSEASHHALDALLHLPLPADLNLTLMYVQRPSDLPSPMQLGPGLSWEAMIDRYDQIQSAAGERIVHHAQAHLRHAGREAAAEFRVGAPADELVAAVRESSADLLVAGSANRSALGRLFLGSVSSRILSHAPCSVLVAREGREKSDSKASRE
jgi:nucleotide-binding universal stress UspA family protein